MATELLKTSQWLQVRNVPYSVTSQKTIIFSAVVVNPIQFKLLWNEQCIPPAALSDSTYLNHSKKCQPFLFIPCYFIDLQQTCLSIFYFYSRTQISKLQMQFLKICGQRTDLILLLFWFDLKLNFQGNSK
jgi:hypothetical protein